MDQGDHSSKQSSTYEALEPDWKIELPLNLLAAGSKRHEETHDDIKRSDEEWLKIFEGGVFFQGADTLLWGRFLACVYVDPATSKFGSLFFDKLGITHIPVVDLHEKSRYHPAVLNLSDENKDSNVRKVLACSLLEKFATLDPEIVKKVTGNNKLSFDYDQTHAGDLANSCKIVKYCSPENLGKSIIAHGLLQPKSVQSVLMDVVYENKRETIDSNNELVYHLGEQLEQLFDPLSEYSPEHTEVVYKPPEYPPDKSPEKDVPLVNSICQELLTLQTNFTLSIIDFLQKVLIPLRIEVLNEDIENLSAVKLNRLFPPTIDEVTRINCIFLDALKSATPYGSFEVLKACSVTVPYFYKAYSRHEAATKNFSKDIKLFLQKFKTVVPSHNVYTEMKIETIIKGPEEKLMKIKLILERLWQSKTWSSAENQTEAEKYFKNTMEIIDSFGKLPAEEMSAYNTRVFTPSGKILTELAKGWPLELQYKWLKRRIVGVYDVIDVKDYKKRDLVVIFSDYVVILSIVEAESYYVENENKPLISDILMNSLINEVPLPPKIPKLQVVSHCYIDKVLTSVGPDESITFNFLDADDPRIFVYKLASSTMKASHIEELCTKATILEKVTAFHLFKSNRCNFNIYFTAHELEAYESETIKSRITLFLNCKPSKHFLKDNELKLAFFAELKDGKVLLTKMDIEGQSDQMNLPLEDLVNIITQQLMENYAKYTFSYRSPYFKEFLVANEKLANSLGHNFNSSDSVNLPPDSMKVSENAHNDFETVHKKQKSYGTITTFRSNISDFKEKKTINSQKAAKNPSKNKIQESSHKKTTKKSRGLLSKFLSIFKKKKKEKKKPVLKKDSDRPAIVNKISHEAKPLPVLSQLKPDERVGSVVHNSKFDDRNDITDPTSLVSRQEKIEISNNLMETESNRTDDAHSSNKLERTDVKSVNYEDDENLRQSQVFNDDLFGDIIPSVPSRTITPVVGPNINISGSSKRLSEYNPKDIPPLFELHNDTNDTNDLAPNSEVLAIEKSSPPEIKEDEFESSSTFANDRSENVILGSQEENVTKPIFPSISKYEIPKVSFTKSPSFAELFKEMRMVLDDTDETVNWRRLTSEISLNEKYAISNGKEREAKNKKRLSIALEQPEKLPDDNIIDTVFCENDAIEKVPKNNKISTFNVVRTSPSKIVKYEDLSRNVTSKSLNSANELASYYPQSPSENVRLVELTFHSQEDLSEKAYFTPKEYPVEIFDRKEKDTNGTEPLEKSDINTISHVDATSNKLPSILDDLEFSSFHMSFDETNNTTTRDSTSETHESFNKSTIINENVYSEPIFYQLNNTKSNETFFSCRDKVGRDEKNSYDDEPMWVSPSKLDIFDLSKKSDATYKSIQNKPRLTTQQSNLRYKKKLYDSSKFDEPSLLRDSSYAYLANLVTEETDEEPVRLQFRN